MLKVHFLGIGGSGASAAAAIAQAQGYEITGCDLEPHNEFTKDFDKIILFLGHLPSHLYCHPERSEGSSMNGEDSSLITQNDKMIDILAVTPAIYSLDPNNPELLEAKKMGIPVLTWQQFLGEYLAKDKFVIAVAGTHGKTTTTAMIAQVLEDAGLDPTVLLGAIHPKWRTNYRIPHQKIRGREFFVIEADEFNDNFLHFKPDISVVTNIEMDHPEYFKNFDAYKASFKKFLRQTKNIVANLKDPVVKEILNVQSRFVHSIIDYSKELIDFPLQIPGEFNRWNASAAYQVGLVLGLDPLTIQKSLATYPGIGRRFEYIGEYQGAKVYSDFGHHPTEIKVTMEATRQKFPNNRLILIYEPHMFSRTKALFNDFVKVFKELTARPAKSASGGRSGVDKIILTDIYPSREIDTGLVSSQQLADAVGDDTLVYHSRDQLLPMLKQHVQNGDIIFFMGAGEADKLARELLS